MTLTVVVRTGDGDNRQQSCRSAARLWPVFRRIRGLLRGHAYIRSVADAGDDPGHHWILGLHRCRHFRRCRTGHRRQDFVVKVSTSYLGVNCWGQSIQNRVANTNKWPKLAGDGHIEFTSFHFSHGTVNKISPMAHSFFHFPYSVGGSQSFTRGQRRAVC